MNERNTIPARAGRAGRLLRWTLGVAAILLALAGGGSAWAAPLKTHTIGKERYVRLQDLASFYGMKYAHVDAKTMRLSNKWNTLVVTLGSREIQLNRRQVWLHTPIQKMSSRSWGITRTDVLDVIDPVLRPEQYLAGKRSTVIVLDAGHGGKDPGASSAARDLEKTITLAIARKVRLRLANEGVRVLMTRTSDRFLELTDRTAYATKNKADLFLSLHLNAAPTRAARGIETFVLTSPGYSSTAGGGAAGRYPSHKHLAANAFLGYALHHALLSQTQTEDRGLRRARFLVLKDAPCPAVLIECGFLSNGKDAELLRGEWYQERVAQGIANGVIEYIKQIKRADLLKD